MRAQFKMPWDRTAEEMPIGQTMLCIVEGLRWSLMDTDAELVWKKAWVAVPKELYLELPCFEAGYRRWMGDCQLERQCWTSGKEIARFISWNHV